jgi:amidase
VTTWIVTDSTPGRGPRVAVKDLIDMAGLPTTAASRPVADRALPAECDAPCVAGLRAAIEAGQARFVGKTNLHELAYGITGINPAFGTPVNPLDPLRMPGGSSSGSGVAVAAGEADIAYGSDTGGSIRIPAACCGIAGLKTTWGRIPLDGVWPLAPGLDTVGPMARDVAGVAVGMALLEPGFTVAVEAPRSVGVLTIDADPRITAAIDDALRRAEFDLVPVTIPDLDKIMAASFTVLDAQAWQSNRDLFAAAAGQIGGDVRDRLERASAITPAMVTAAQAVLASWRETLDGLWRRVEMLAAPSLLGFPPLLDEVHLMWKLRMLTSPVNVAGVPALALPIPVRGRDAGPIPANVQLIGPHNSEERLLAAGARIEQAVLSALGIAHSSACGGSAEGSVDSRRARSSRRLMAWLTNQRSRSSPNSSGSPSCSAACWSSTACSTTTTAPCSPRSC